MKICRRYQNKVLKSMWGVHGGKFNIIFILYPRFFLFLRYLWRDGPQRGRWRQLALCPEAGQSLLRGHRRGPDCPGPLQFPKKEDCNVKDFIQIENGVECKFDLVETRISGEEELAEQAGPLLCPLAHSLVSLLHPHPYTIRKHPYIYTSSNRGQLLLTNQ